MCILDQSCSICLQIVKSPTSTVYSPKTLSPIAPHVRMNLQCVLYMLVKTRSICRPSFECSKRSKSTFHTVCKHCLHSKAHTSTLKRGVTTYLHIYESALLLLHAGENQKSVSFVIRVQQRIKVDLLHTVCKHCLDIQRVIPPHSRGVSPHIYIFYESALLLLHAGENQKSVSFVMRVQQRIKVDLLHTVSNCVK